MTEENHVVACAVVVTADGFLTLQYCYFLHKNKILNQQPLEFRTA
jgi:hypothetical protein